MPHKTFSKWLERGFALMLGYFCINEQIMKLDLSFLFPITSCFSADLYTQNTPFPSSSQRLHTRIGLRVASVTFHRFPFGSCRPTVFCCLHVSGVFVMIIGRKEQRRACTQLQNRRHFTGTRHNKLAESKNSHRH